MTTKHEIEQATFACITKANTLYNTNIVLHHIEWYSSGQAAGYAMYKRGIMYIRYSEEALRKDPEDMLNDTVPHEVAHIVMYARKKQGFNLIGGAHGYSWRIACKALGGSGKRCHDIPLTRARKTTAYKYRAASGREVSVGATIHKKIQYGQDRWFNDTKEPIRAEHFTGIVEQRQ